MRPSFHDTVRKGQRFPFKNDHNSVVILPSNRSRKKQSFAGFHDDLNLSVDAVIKGFPYR